MGHAYWIFTKAAMSEEMVAMCLRLGGERISEPSLMFEFRAPGTPPAPGMPDVLVSLHPGKIWFSGSGGTAEFTAVLLRRFLDAAIEGSSDGGVRVEEE